MAPRGDKLEPDGSGGGLVGLLGRRGWDHPSLTVVSFPMPLRSPQQGYPARLPGGGGWAGSTRSGSACPSGYRGVSSGQGWPAPLSVGSPGDDPGPLSARPRAPVGLPALSSASHSHSPLSRKSGSFAPGFSALIRTRFIKWPRATVEGCGFRLPPTPEREGRLARFPASKLRAPFQALHESSSILLRIGRLVYAAGMRNKSAAPPELMNDLSLWLRSAGPHQPPRSSVMAHYSSISPNVA